MFYLKVTKFVQPNWKTEIKNNKIKEILQKFVFYIVKHKNLLF